MRKDLDTLYKQAAQFRSAVGNGLALQLQREPRTIRSLLTSLKNQHTAHYNFGPRGATKYLQQNFIESGYVYQQKIKVDTGGPGTQNGFGLTPLGEIYLSALAQHSLVFSSTIGYPLSYFVSRDSMVSKSDTTSVRLGALDMLNSNGVLSITDICSELLLDDSTFRSAYVSRLRQDGLITYKGLKDSSSRSKNKRSQLEITDLGKSFVSQWWIPIKRVLESGEIHSQIQISQVCFAANQHAILSTSIDMEPRYS